MELSEFDVRYRPREAIKAQAVAGFIAEFTLPMISRVETRGHNYRSSVWMVRPHNMHEEFCNHQRGIIWIMPSVYSFRRPIMKLNMKPYFRAWS